MISLKKMIDEFDPGYHDPIYSTLMQALIESVQIVKMANSEIFYAESCEGESNFDELKIKARAFIRKWRL